MTTEQCSIDSLPPKNRTETFARQLQNRLRTLSAESERDGLEDTSWNGDQLSSSSDNEIYYDLDSSPGSPAEEATETSFPEYINVKNSDCIHSGSSSSNLLNHNEFSLNENDKSDCNYLGQINKSDNLSNCKNINNLGNNYYRVNCSDKVIESCNQCSSTDRCDGVSLPQLNVNDFDNTYSISCTQNGVSDSNRSFNRELNLTDEINSPHETNGYNHLSPSESFDERNKPGNSFGTITANNRLCKEIDETKQESDCCNSCDKSDSFKSVDVNCNSRNTCPMISSAPTIQVSEMIEDCSGRFFMKEHLENIKSIPVNEFYQENKGNSSHANGKESNLINNKKDTEEYTEKELCRLVDAVFSKSQSSDYIKGNVIDIGDSDRIDNGEDHDLHDVDTDDDDDEKEESIESKRSKFRRCSSLKTGKTPPGTPGCKKIVRFADVLGLDLADVRTFLDEIPKVPKSAFVDLKNVELSSSPPVHTSPLDYLGGATSASTRTPRAIVPLFQQPSSRSDFLYRIRDGCVCLENAIVSDPILSVITGFVRVKNIDFHKSVHIRYSIDNWKSYADLQAKYVPNSCDGFSDKFSFMLYAHMLNIGQRLEFAVRYHTKGSLYWDSNLGENYAFQCVPDGSVKITSPSYIPSRPPETWGSFY